MYFYYSIVKKYENVMSIIISMSFFLLVHVPIVPLKHVPIVPIPTEFPTLRVKIAQLDEFATPPHNKTRLKTIQCWNIVIGVSYRHAENLHILQLGVTVNF